MTTKKTPPPVPVVLELAPLPREQIGPFLLLGVDKTATKHQVEANWAQRLIWARKGQTRVPLEDVNWARDALQDVEKRVRADAGSLNQDTTEGVLKRLQERYGGNRKETALQPLDVEKPLEEYTPPAELPDLQAVRAAIVVPEVPEDVPAVRRVLEQFLQEPLDPWKLNLPPSS